MSPLSALQRYTMLGLVIALAITLGWAVRLNGLRAGYVIKWHDEQAQTQLAQSKTMVSNASLGQCQAALNAKNAETDARAKAMADSKAQDAKDVASADARAKADHTRLETLRALAAQQTPGGGCKASSALLNALQGL